MATTNESKSSDNRNAKTWCDEHPDNCESLCKEVLKAFLIERPEFCNGRLASSYPFCDWNPGAYYYSDFLKPISQWVQAVGESDEKQLRVNYLKLVDLIFSDVATREELHLPRNLYQLTHLERLQLTVLYIMRFAMENTVIESSNLCKLHLENMISPYWTMVGKVVYMEQKERYAIFNQFYEDKYGNMWGIVGNFCKKWAHGDSFPIKAKLQELSVRYQIIRIDTAYHVMFTYWGTNPSFNHAFLVREDYRRAMVTNGGIFWYEQAKPVEITTCEQQPATKELPWVDEPANFVLYDFNNLQDRDLPHSGKGLGDVVESLKKLVGILNSPETPVNIPKPWAKDPKETVRVMQISTLSYWGGCGMKIPLNVGINVSFEKVFPSIYVKANSDRDTVIIQEYAWHTMMVIQNPCEIKINEIDLWRIVQDSPKALRRYQDKDHIDIEENGITASFDKYMTNHLGASVTFRGQQLNSVACFELSKQKYSQLMDSDFIANPKIVDVSIDPNDENGHIVRSDHALKYFRHLDLRILKALKDCKVVVELPYVTPQSDALTKVSFGKGDDSEDEIIASCS